MLDLKDKLIAFSEKERSVIGAFAVTEAFTSLMPGEQKELMEKGMTRRFSPTAAVEAVVDGILYYNKWPADLELVPDPIVMFNMTDRQIWLAKHLRQSFGMGEREHDALTYVNALTVSVPVEMRLQVYEFIRKDPVGPLPCSTHVFPDDIRQMGKFTLLVKELNMLEDLLANDRKVQAATWLRTNKGMSLAEAASCCRTILNEY